MSYHIARICHITSHHITSHHITSHHITSHHITSHHITSHHITSHHITSHHITSHHITSHHITSHHITSHHITRICHITSPTYVTSHHPHKSHHMTRICHITHHPHMSHHIARICHMPTYVTLPAYVTCPQMSHQPFGWKMLVTTFQFTVRYKWSERKAPVPCTCFKIHYSLSTQKQKMIQIKSVYMSGYVYSTFIFLPSPSLFNYNMYNNKKKM